MADIRLGTPTSKTDILTTTLNSLANLGSVQSSAIDQDAVRYLYAYFELFIAAQGANRVNGCHLKLQILPTLDGTNYPSVFASNLADANLTKGQFNPDPSVTTARRMMIGPVLLPPVDFTVLLHNDTGQALAASGNILSIVRFGVVTV